MRKGLARLSSKKQERGDIIMSTIIGIYMITNTINGHKYVGQSVDIYRRWRDHRNFKEKSNILSKAIRKHGLENFKFEILKECEINELDKYEIFFINKYNTYSDGYNATLGGAGTHGFALKISETTLKEIVKDLKDSTLTQNEIASKFDLGIDTISEINQGKTRRLPNVTYPIRNNTKEINHCIICGKEIDRQAVHCVHCSHIAQRKVIDRPSNTEMLSLLKNHSYEEVARMYEVSSNSIRKWLGNSRPVRKNKEKIEKPSIIQNKKVAQYDKNNNFVKEYKSVSEAARALGNIKYDSNISRCARGQRATANGFIWKFV